MMLQCSRGNEVTDKSTAKPERFLQTTDRTWLAVLWKGSGELRGIPGSGVSRKFVRGCSTNSVEDRGQRKRDLGAVAPSQEFHSICK
jgi:hypothetical protein